MTISHKNYKPPLLILEVLVSFSRNIYICQISRNVPFKGRNDVPETSHIDYFRIWHQNLTYHLKLQDANIWTWMQYLELRDLISYSRFLELNLLYPDVTHISCKKSLNFLNFLIVEYRVIVHSFSEFVHSHISIIGLRFKILLDMRHDLVSLLGCLISRFDYIMKRSIDF